MKKVVVVLALLGACLIPRLAAQSNQLSPALTPVSATLFEADGVTNLNAQVLVQWQTCKVRGVAVPDGKMLVTVINGAFATSLPPCDTLYQVSYTSQGAGVAMFWKVQDTASSQGLSNLIAVDPPAANKSLVFACGATATCSPTNTSTALKIFYGSAPLAGGTVTVTGFSPVFTSTSSFTCTVTDGTATNAARIQYISTSSITITGTTTDTVNYICIGS